MLFKPRLVKALAATSLFGVERGLFIALQVMLVGYQMCWSFLVEIVYRGYIMHLFWPSQLLSLLTLGWVDAYSITVHDVVFYLYTWFVYFWALML